MVKNVVIWVIGLVMAVFVGLTAMGAIAKNKAPALAVSIYPTNGFAAEKLAALAIAGSIAENQGQFPNRVPTSVTALAKKAFISEPITPDAIAVLGLSRRESTTRKLMGATRQLSRRQPLVTGWMIADSGARKDLSALLDHYDTMLRTKASAASVVIPAMAGGLADDGSIVPFAGLLSKQPPWANQFWAAVIENRESLANAVRLREKLYKPNQLDGAYRDADLIRALINNDQFNEALRLYRLLLDDQSTESLIENGSFETKPLYPPLDWQLFSTGEYGAAITEGRLELSAIENSGGLFARQLVNLPARILTMEVNPSTSIANDAALSISLRCAQKLNDPPQVIRIPVKRTIEDLKINNARSGCNFYWLEINGRASATGDGFDMALDSITLR